MQAKKYTFTQARKAIQDRYGYQFMDFGDPQREFTQEEFDKYVKETGEYLTDLFNRTANGELDDDDDDEL